MLESSSSPKFQLLSAIAYAQAQHPRQIISAEQLWEDSPDTIRFLAAEVAFPARRAAAAATNGNNNEVVVWALGEGNSTADNSRCSGDIEQEEHQYDDGDGDDDDEDEGSVEYLNLDGEEDDDDEEEDGSSTEQDAFLKSERRRARMLAQLGFINTRHAMFAAAGVIPDPREVEQWQENFEMGRNNNRKEAARIQMRAATPGATFLAASAALAASQQNDSAVNRSTTSTSAAECVSLSPPRYRKRKPTLTMRTLLQILGGSAAEICEFEHAPLIIAQRPLAVLSRQETPLEALQQLWQVFQESELSGRVTAACIAALDRVFVGVMTHQKLAAEFGTRCGALTIKMMHAVIGSRWQFLGGEDEAAVVSALISTVLSAPRVQVLDAVDPTAFLLSPVCWGGGVNAAALLELNVVFQKKFAAVAAETFTRLEKTSAHVAALKRITHANM